MVSLFQRESDPIETMMLNTLDGHGKWLHNLSAKDKELKQMVKKQEEWTRKLDARVDALESAKRESQNAEALEREIQVWEKAAANLPPYPANPPKCFKCNKTMDPTWERGRRPSLVGTGHDTWIGIETMLFGLQPTNVVIHGEPEHLLWRCSCGWSMKTQVRPEGPKLEASL